MAAVSQDGISHIVIVRSLNVIEQDNVLELYGIAYNTVSTYQSRASDEGSVADFGIGSDDAGCSQIC